MGEEREAVGAEEGGCGGVGVEDDFVVKGPVVAVLPKRVVVTVKHHFNILYCMCVVYCILCEVLL